MKYILSITPGAATACRRHQHETGFDSAQDTQYQLVRTRSIGSLTKLLKPTFDPNNLDHNKHLQLLPRTTQTKTEYYRATTALSKMQATQAPSSTVGTSCSGAEPMDIGAIDTGNAKGRRTRTQRKRIWQRTQRLQQRQDKGKTAIGQAPTFSGFTTFMSCDVHGPTGMEVGGIDSVAVVRGMRS